MAQIKITKNQNSLSGAKYRQKNNF